jgi:hypothetical protein
MHALGAHVARHRLQAQQPHRSRHSDTHLSADPSEVMAGRVGPAPDDVRATIQRYWADGMDAHDIAARLAGSGVTIHDVLVERYLRPG